METAEVLRKIKAMCKKEGSCNNCVLKKSFCYTVPDHWIDAEMEGMADIIDNYKEEEEKDV